MYGIVLEFSLNQLQVFALQLLTIYLQFSKSNKSLRIIIHSTNICIALAYYTRYCRILQLCLNGNSLMFLVARMFSLSGIRKQCMLCKSVWLKTRILILLYGDRIASICINLKTCWKEVGLCPYFICKQWSMLYFRWHWQVTLNNHEVSRMLCKSSN